MTVADFIKGQKGRKQMVMADVPWPVRVAERPKHLPTGLERSRALLKAAEIVLVHFSGDGEDWTLRDDNRTVVLDDETTFSINDY